MCQNRGVYSSNVYLIHTINQKISNVKLSLFFKSPTSGTKKTPLHVSIGQTVHEISRSKQLIQMLNRLGISMSYDEVERQNCSLSSRTIEKSGKENVPKIIVRNLVHSCFFIIFDIISTFYLLTLNKQLFAVVFYTR